MLVIDDNKIRLLKMKESLLKVSPDDQDKILSEYKDIVLEVDRELYDGLVNEINNTNYHNQPYETQLTMLTQLASMYDEFNEFQCRYRETYGKYVNDELDLSDISDIKIDKIKEKIDAINGYLINKQNEEENENKLEELNIELIEAEKRKKSAADKFLSLEKTLKDNLFLAEGRKYDDENNLAYTSVKDEYIQSSIDLKAILYDNTLIEEELGDANKTLTSSEEKMEAAKICFNNMPTMDTKKLYNVSVFDVLKAKYRVLLLEIVKLVAIDYDKYDEVKNKRIKISNLIHERLEYLQKLGVRLFVDPFDHIKLKEQLEVIESIGDVEKAIAEIKNNIQEITTKNEEAKTNKLELLKIVEEDTPLYINKDAPVELEIVENKEDIPSEEEIFINNSEVFDDNGETLEENSEVFEENNNDIFLDSNEVVFNSDESVQDDTLLEQKEVKSNSVISVKELPNNFQVDVVKQKTDEVINRIYRLLNPVSTSEQTVPVTVETNSTVAENIFQDVKPFEETVLFDNRYDDGVFNGPPAEVMVNNNIVNTPSVSPQVEVNPVDNNIMPEIFWTTKNENGEEEVVTEETLSFDEQVEQLLSDDSSDEVITEVDNNGKVKKLVA